MDVVPLAVGESERDREFGFESSRFEMEESRRRRREVLTREEARFAKRTYGFRSSCLERRGLDQQLEELRAVIPTSIMRPDRSDPNILVDAYYYIAALLKQVEDLSNELLEDDLLARTHDKEIDARSLPMVEVVKRDGTWEVRMKCANRPGLLVDLIKVVESNGLIVVDGKIACHSNIVFEYLSLKRVREGSVTDVGDAEEPELDSLKAKLASAIRGTDVQ